jgi:hypothetical protein
MYSCELIQAVAQDAFGRLEARREARHELIERALRIEHHRVELASGSAAEPVERDACRLGSKLRHAERVLQALGGVDRQQRDLTAAQGRGQRQRRRHRRLAHAAAAEAEQHLSLLQQRLDPTHRGVR